MYTKTQLDKAKLVEEIKHKLGFESSSGLIKTIRNGCINNLPIGIKDIIEADKILGKDPAEIKGKATAKRSTIFPCITKFTY